MKLANTEIAILIEDIYEDLEFWYPYYRLKEEGAQITVLGTGKTSYKGKKGIPAHEDTDVGQASADELDAVVIPGGYAPDRMRRHQPMIDFVTEAYQNGTLVALICPDG
jgi:protease I